MLTLDPSGVNVVGDEEHNLLTGNGPQAVHAQAEKLVQIVIARKNTIWPRARNDFSEGAPARDRGGADKAARQVHVEATVRLVYFVTQVIASSNDVKKRVGHEWSCREA